MSALTDYLASPGADERVKAWDRYLRVVRQQPDLFRYKELVGAALNALCEQLDADRHYSKEALRERNKARDALDKAEARIRELEQFITRQSEIVDETKAACEETLRQAAERGRELEAVRQCGAKNPHGMIPRKCPSCGEEMIPLPCMQLAMESYKDGNRELEAENARLTERILQLETERDTARAERDRARDTAAGLFEVCP